MANNKEIIRDEYIRIKMSKEEKNLWIAFAEKNKINPTRLARNILMMEAESTFNKITLVPAMKAYVKYLEITNNKEAMDRIKSD